MKRLPFVDLAALHAELGEELEAAVLEVCRSQRFIGGEQIDAFEEAFASYLDAPHAIGVANGTDALDLALRALGLQAGDEVLVPANTFIATAEGVVAAGGVPRFVDVEPDSGLVDLESAEARIGPRTRAIIPVHLYGRMADMDAIEAFASRHGLLVVEDAAQAHGAVRSGRRAGTVGHVGSFSFYPGKNLGAFGDAGALVTSDGELAERLRLMRDHGRSGRDNHVLIGANRRLDTLQAAVLAVKLPHVDRWNRARAEAAARYRELLDDVLLDWVAEDPDSEVHHLFPILTDRRDELAAFLADNGIATGVHYRCSLPLTGAFEDSGDECPVAAERARRQLSLPMHPYLDPDDVERVAETVRRFDG